MRDHQLQHALLLLVFAGCAVPRDNYELGLSNVTATHLAADSSHVYWVDHGFEWAGNPELHGAAIDSMPSNGGVDGTRLVLTDGELAMDETSVYYVQYAPDPLANVHRINAVAKHGGAPRLVLELTTPQASLPPRNITVVGNELLFTTEYPTRVHWLTTSGRAHESVVVPEAGPAAVAMDSDHAYVATYQRVWRISKSSHDVVELAYANDFKSLFTLDPDEINVLSRDLALAGSTLVWAIGEIGLFADQDAGAVLSIPASGGIITTIARGIDRPGCLAVDPTHVYWTANGEDGATRIFRAPRATGVVEMFADGVGPIYAMALGDDAVYWSLGQQPGEHVDEIRWRAK